MAEARYLPVARFAKPHGLKGEAIVFVLTEQAEDVFVPGRELTPLDGAGQPAGGALILERGRPYHRRWLLKFEEIDDRAGLEAWRGVVLGIPDQRTESASGLMVHEVPGAKVVVDGKVLGVAREVLLVPGGPLLVVDGDGREYLIPYRAPILVGTDRTRREITVDPPPGLLEL
jgi:16S rRNA processing protein RimM